MFGVNPCFPRIKAKLGREKRLWLFLDYDGTLAEFAPTPDHVQPDSEIGLLVSNLASIPTLRVAIVSGRRLSHVQRLLPLENIYLAGSYGIELLIPGGERINRLNLDKIRPTLERIKPYWGALIANDEGFYLEDKEWSIALHARFAEDNVAERVLKQAREHVGNFALGDEFRVIGGHKFLEIAPRIADKGQTVSFLMEEFPWEGAIPLYLGDDDMDEEAFGVIQASGGVAVMVSAEPRQSSADCSLLSPMEVRRWLTNLPNELDLPKHNNL